MPKWFNLHRPLLYDPQLQLKIKKMYQCKLSVV